MDNQTLPCVDFHNTMTTESYGDAVELRTSPISDPADGGSVRDSETYCHAVQLNLRDSALPDVVTENNVCDEKPEDPYDTIGPVGTLPKNKYVSCVMPDDILRSSIDKKGCTVPPSTGYDSDMASSQSLASYATWNQLPPTNEGPPSGSTPGWCSFKRGMIIGIVLLIIVLVSCLTVTSALLHAKTSGQTGASPDTPPSSTKATSTVVSTTTPTTVPSTSTTTTSLSTSTPSTPTPSSSSSASVSPSTSSTSISPSTTTISDSPSTTTISDSPSTTTITPSTSVTPPTIANTTNATTSSITPRSSTASTSLSPPTSTTTVTTTLCKSSRMCHSCNSRNVRCPVNGNLAGTDPGEVMPCPCGTACFSDVNHVDGNIVHRGCTEQYPEWDRASSNNRSCQDVGDDHFLCFCLGDRCNTHNMTPYIP
ncbi:uncharacterized protein [Haliotis cracherodii]|uniref:uncharacterized protein n=1 Tax=Haliotis cracherodii TaxID=6455 RepID=UPI0039EAC586